MLWSWFQMGGPVMYLLLACSVVAMTVVTERFLFWSRVRGERNPGGVQRVLTLAQQGRIPEALTAGRSVEDPVARVLTRGLEHWPAAVTSALEAQVRQEMGPMRRYMGVLDTAITLAPLLGIYGTITGMIRAFGFLSRAGLPDPQLVASGIAEALITTAFGLTIAILAIPPYNFFAAKTEEIAHEIERNATTLELLAQGSDARAPDPFSQQVSG
ncbi:MAG: MotA/TolQ/ExbB proton channel family protein [Candidatus Omnitrophica bacterium]|nr:MotA/TolQ/ExbB proton channel family protein [Candidatus Omnitrophota bacterium]